MSDMQQLSYEVCYLIQLENSNTVDESRKKIFRENKIKFRLFLQVCQNTNTPYKPTNMKCCSDGSNVSIYITD